MKGAHHFARLINMPYLYTNRNKAYFDVNRYVMLEVTQYPSENRYVFTFTPRPLKELEGFNPILKPVTNYDLRLGRQLTPEMVIEFTSSVKGDRLLYDLTYEASQHVFERNRLRTLIEGQPNDVELLKKEYYAHTGTNFRRTPPDASHVEQSLN